MLFAANISIEQEVIVGHYDGVFYTYPLLMYTNARSIEAE